MAESKAQHAASMLPSTFTEGGLWDDVDVEISDIAWVKFNFAKEGAPAQIRLALGVECWPLEGLEAGHEPNKQMFSAGDLKYFVPSADDNGAYAMPVGNKSAMNSNTNSSLFITSLFEVATPEQAAWLNETLASGNCKGLIGLKLHVKRVPQKERKGLSQQENQDRTPTVMLATNLIALPGETDSVVTEGAGQAAAPVAATAARPAARPAAASPVAAPASRAAVGGKANGAVARPAAKPAASPTPGSWTQSAMEAKASEALLEILNANQGLVEFPEIPKQGFRAEALKSVPPQVRQKVCAIMYDEQWLGKQEGVAYDPATATVALA